MDSIKDHTERPIRFYCRKCGREMWEMADYEECSEMPIWAVLEALICSDCLLREARGI